MKNVILLALALCICASCNTKTEKTNSDNQKLVTEYFNYFNSHNWVKLASMYAEIAEFKDPTLGQGIVKQSRQQTIDKYTQLTKIFPNLNDKVTATYPSGENNIIVEFTSSGTAVDGTMFELPICSILTIENGIIAKDFTYFDNFEEPSPEK
jgi:ketosteroid isomerase-like protein